MVHLREGFYHYSIICEKNQEKLRRFEKGAERKAPAAADDCRGCVGMIKV
jgi:hypothetical protein